MLLMSKDEIASSHHVLQNHESPNCDSGLSIKPTAVTITDGFSGMLVDHTCPEGGNSPLWRMLS